MEHTVERPTLPTSVCFFRAIFIHRLIPTTDTPGGDNVVLLTTTRLLSFWHKRLRLDWELPFSNVQGVTVEDNGIRFSHKSGREHDKFVFIPDKSSQSWFFGQVAGVVKTLNTKRRMDS